MIVKCRGGRGQEVEEEVEEEVERSSCSNIIASLRVTRRTLFPVAVAVSRIHKRSETSSLLYCRASPSVASGFSENASSSLGWMPVVEGIMVSTHTVVDLRDSASLTTETQPL